MRSVQRRRLLTWLVASAAVTGCLSPTLPMPPPSPPEIDRIGAGQYLLRGTIPAPGTLLVLNRRSKLVFGVVTEDFYELRVTAEPGDPMVLWYEASGEASDSVDFAIPDAAAAPDGGADAGADGPADSGAD